MPEPWQLAVILASWFAAASMFDRRQSQRATADQAMNQELLKALRDLFEQREQHTKEK